MQTLGDIFAMMAVATGAAHNSFALFFSHPRMPPALTSWVLKLCGTLQFENLSVSYPGRLGSQVLHSMSFQRVHPALPHHCDVAPMLCVMPVMTADSKSLPADPSKVSDPLAGVPATAFKQASCMYACCPAQTVALVGPSGGGKSSVVKLLQRYYVPSGGSVRLDGRDLGLYEPKWLKRHIGFVNQEPTLYARSIRRCVAGLEVPSVS